MKVFYSFLSTIALISTLNAQQSLKLVKDLSPDDVVRSSISNIELISFNNEVYFAAGTDSLGKELWKSDGSLNNTTLLKDINTGDSGRDPSDPMDFTIAGNQLYFTAVDSLFFRNLWKTDGTAAGTQKVNTGQLFQEISGLTALGNDLIFVGEEFNGDKKIWKTDGTSSGTTAISSNMMITPSTLTELNGTIYFIANFNELWKTDGTSTGTSIIQTFTTLFVSNLNAVGSNLYLGGYYSDGIILDIELWTSDGTASGTSLIRSYTNSNQSSSFLPPTNFTGPFQNKVLFTMDLGNAPGIYVTDGTSSGTTLIKALSNRSGPPSDNGFFTEFQGEAYFSDSLSLWRTNLNSNRVVLVTDSFVVSKFSEGNNVVFSNELYFNGFARNATSPFQRKLWKTDGTGNGTIAVKDGLASGGYAINNGELLFIGADSLSGTELWKSDGTAAGTNLVKDILPNLKRNSSFSPFYSTSAVTYFLSNGVLWTTDGSTSGTENITTQQPLYASFSISDSVYFRVDDTLFKTDGTRANVSQAFVYPANVGKVTEVDPMEINGFLYYGAPTSFANGDLALWRTDGTLSGTTLIKTLYPNSNSPNNIEPNSFILVNGEVYFSAIDNLGLPEIWKSDGTSAGTIVVQSNDPNGFSYGSTTRGTVYNNELYIPASNGSNNSFSLWKVNSGGATVVTSKLDAIENLVEFNGELFFSGLTTNNGFELWKTDGTDLGTQLVKDINPGSASSSSRDFVVYNGSLIFSAYDGTNGYELWTSDGTTANTVLLKDLFPGIGGGSPSFFQEMGDTLYFVAFHPTLGRELWKTDGTANGTVIRGDINPGAPSSNPEKLTKLDSVLLFVAENPNYGKELWRLGACQAEQYVDDITACEQLTWIDGVTYTNSTSGPTFSVPDQFGCDSVVTLNLTILNSSFSTDTRVACDSLLWLDGNTYTASTNSPTFTRTNSVGCDSIITLDLTILGATSTTVFDTSCTAITWRDGKTYARSTNTPFITLTNSIGCDSIVNLDFTYTGVTTTINETACKSFTWIDGITYTASTDTPTVVVNLPSGCDSAITLNLTILPDVTAFSSNDTLYASALQGRYQWLDCNNAFAPLAGDTLRSFYPDINGSYAVEVDQNGCVDTSECIITTVGLKENVNEQNVVLYPNPSSEHLFIEVENQVFSSIQIFDSRGKLIVGRQEVPTAIDVSNLESGVYFLKLSNNTGFVNKRFMILR